MQSRKFKQEKKRTEKECSKLLIKNIAILLCIAALLIFISPLYAAFPQVQSITETAVNTPATAHAFTMPATVNAGDLLLMLTIFSDGTDANIGATTPSGWSQRYDLDITTSAANEFINAFGYVIAAVGNEDGTTVDVVTDRAARGLAHVYRITAWRNSGTILNDIEQESSNAHNQSTHSAPSLNPTNWGTEDTLWITWDSVVFNAITSKTGDPANYTNVESQLSSDNSPRMQIHSARRELNGASEDPGDWVHSANNPHICGIIAIRTACPTITIDDTLADGTKDVAYTGTVSASGGTAAYTYAVTAGALPTGVSLAANGALTGTPTVANTFTFTITATDAIACTGVNSSYSVTIIVAATGSDTKGSTDWFEGKSPLWWGQEQR